MEKMPWDDVPVEESQTTAKMPWDDVPNETPMDTPTAEELEKYSKPDPNRASLKQGYKPLDNSQDLTQEEANTIPMGDMTTEETIQYNRDTNTADAYKNYQGGNIIQKDGKTEVRTEALPQDFEVTTDMYSKTDNPQRLYNTLQKLSDGVDITGKKTYKGRIIPEPTDYSGALPSGPGMSTSSALVADTVRETGKNLLTAVAAGLDEVTQSMGFNTNYIKSVQDGIADPAKAEKVSHALGKEVLRAGTSVALGMKAGKTIGNATDQGRLNTWVLSVAGGMALETLTKNPDDGNLVVGDNSLVELNEGFNPEEGKTDADKFWRKKGDQALDSALTAGPVSGAMELGVKGIGLGVNLYKKLKSAIAPNEAEIAKEEAEAFMTAIGAKTPQEIVPKIEQIQKSLKEEGKVNIDFADGTINPVQVQRTSMSAIAEGAEKQGDSQLANVAMEQEKLAHKQGNLNTAFDTTKQQPIRTLAKTQQEAVDSRGGIPAIEQTKNLLADSAINKIEKAGNRVTTAKSQADDFLRSRQSEAIQGFNQKQTNSEMTLGAAEDIFQGSKEEQRIATQGLQELFQKDEAFAKSIQELSQSSGIDVGKKFRAQATDEILPDLVEGVRRIKQKKNDLYTAIPDDSDIDEQSFIKAWQDASEADAIPKEVHKILSDHLGDDIDKMEVLTFGKVYSMLPKINKVIIDLESSAKTYDVNKINALKALRDNINVTQMQHLIDVGDAEVAQAAKDARDYYKYTYIKFARDRDTPIGSLFDAYDNAFDDHLAIGARDSETGKLTQIEDINENYKVKRQARRVVKDGLDYDTGLPEQVVDFVKNEDTGIDSGKFLGPYKGKVLDAMNKILEENGGDFSKIKPYDVNKALEDEGVSLTKHFPEDTQKINDFIEEFKTKKSQVDTSGERIKTSEKYLEKTEGMTDKVLSKAEKEKQDILDSSKKTAKDAVKKAEKSAESEEQKIWKSALGKFIEKSPDGSGKPVATGNGYDSFKKLLTKPGNENKIKYIADEIKKSGDKNAQKGFEGAMFELINESLISDANSFKVKGAQVSKFLSDSKSLKDYGKIIFGNSTNPEEAANGVSTFESLLKLVDVVNKEQLKNVSTTSALGQEKDQTVAEAKKAANYLISVIWGRFNSTSLRLSSTAGRYLDTLNPQARRQAVISEMYNNPDRYHEVLEVLKEGMKSPPNSELRRALSLTGVLMGKNAVSGEDKREEVKKRIPAGVF